MFDWFWKFLYGLLKTVLYCIDFIMDFAAKLGGIQPVKVPVSETESTDTDLTYYFLTSESVVDAFKLVAMIGVTLVFIFTAFAVLRASVRGPDNGKGPVRTSLEGAKALLYFLLVPAIMWLGALCVSAIMTSIYQATTLGGTTPGGAIFALVADEAFVGGGDKATILDNFRRGELSGFDYYVTAQVKTYFDLSDINYFLGFVGGVTVLVMIMKALITFVERIISLVMLFIVAPISVSTAVLDDGARFKLWRDQVINKFLMAYGALIAVNIFALMINIIMDVTFFEDDFWNGLAQFVFVIGGAGACRQGVVLIGNLINQGAGSQQAQDDAMTMGPLNKMGYMAHRAASRIGHTAAHAATHNPLTKSLHNKFSSTIHRRSNATRAAKDEIAKNKELARLNAKAGKGRATATGGGLGGASGIPGTQGHTGKNSTTPASTQSPARTLGQALSGAGNAAQNTVLGAMRSGVGTGGAAPGASGAGNGNKT